MTVGTVAATRSGSIATRSLPRYSSRSVASPTELISSVVSVMPSSRRNQSSISITSASIAGSSLSPITSAPIW
jgi:hypothetical protein